ncbi:MAG: ankyrin repeat domain-containing protein [Myxococcaceae bacterium]
MTPLEKAAAEGKLALVRELLESNRSSLSSALGTAVRMRHLDVARLLLEHGADANGRDTEWSPLMHAVKSGLDAVQLLREFGADVRARAKDGKDALHVYLVVTHSIRDEVTADLGVVQYLLDAGLAVRSGTHSHLMAACFTNNASIVELLLARGADPNEQGILGAVALRSHGREMLAALVRAGIAPNAHEVDRFRDTTVLTDVCARGDVETATTLIDRGADPNFRGTSSPLARAVESGNQVLVDLLLERGARPLVAPLPEETTRALDLAEAAARARPGDASARLTWAKTLHASGFRAAAACEADALRRTGVDVPLELSSFDAHGTRWTFVDLPRLEGLAPRTTDERYPRAMVSEGRRTVPLLLTSSPPCTTCDEKGEEVCTDCDGTGTHFEPTDFGDFREESCPTRQPCSNCFGLKFVVVARRFSKGACVHSELDEELTVGLNVFRRCRVCGLASIYGETHWRYRRDDYFACAVCGRFLCTCAANTVG